MNDAVTLTRANDHELVVVVMGNVKYAEGVGSVRRLHFCDGSTMDVEEQLVDIMSALS